MLLDILKYGTHSLQGAAPAGQWVMVLLLFQYWQQHVGLENEPLFPIYFYNQFIYHLLNSYPHMHTRSKTFKSQNYAETHSQRCHQQLTGDTDLWLRTALGPNQYICSLYEKFMS